MSEPISIISATVFGLVGVNLSIDLITKTYTGINTFIKRLCNDRYILIDFNNISQINCFFIQYNLFNLINSVNFPCKNKLNTYIKVLLAENGTGLECFNEDHIVYLFEHGNKELDSAAGNLLNKKRKIEIPMEEIKISTKVKFNLNNVDIKKILTKKSTHKYSSFLYKLKVREWKNYNIKQKEACIKKLGSGNEADIGYLTQYYTTWKGFLGEGNKEKFDYFWSGNSGYYHNGLDGTKTPFEINLEFYIIPYFRDSLLSGYYFQTNKKLGSNELLNNIIEISLKKLTDKITETHINFKSDTSHIEISELEIV